MGDVSPILITDSMSEGDPSCRNCPLTLLTTFTPPTTCFDNWTPVTTYTELNLPGILSISFTQDSTKAECVPPGLSSCASCGATNVGGVCPSGWLAASVGVGMGYTTNYCCPPEAETLTVENGYPTASTILACAGQITSSLKKFIYNLTLPVTSDTPTIMTTAGSTVTSFIPINKSTVSEVTETIFVNTGGLAANPIIAVYASNEFPSSVTLASTTNADSSMLTSSKTSIIRPTLIVTSSPSGEQGTLSSGARVGIGVGVVLGLCVMVALGFLIYRSRKRKTTGGRNTSGGERPESNNMQIQTAELSNDAMRDHELPDSSRQELEEHHGVA